MNGSGFRVGIGYDSHRLVAGRRLILGGIEIPFELGLDGHSDADALTHAITDAVLGAAGVVPRRGGCPCGRSSSNSRALGSL